MSTGAKRSHAMAFAEAEAFRKLFPETAYGKWVIAGSIRRGKPEVGDVDHVVIPLAGQVDIPSGLFVEPRTVNLLWHHLDGLVAAGTLGKALNAAGRTCWGERTRSVSFKGFTHQIFTAEPENFGAQLAIRTGPDSLSRALVMGLRDNGYVQDDRNVHSLSAWSCPCSWRGSAPTWVPTANLHAAALSTLITEKRGEELLAATCPVCRQTKGLDRDIVPVPDEITYFKMAGLKWVAPELRGRS